MTWLALFIPQFRREFNQSWASSTQEKTTKTAKPHSWPSVNGREQKLSHNQKVPLITIMLLKQNYSKLKVRFALYIYMGSTHNMMTLPLQIFIVWRITVTDIIVFHIWLRNFSREKRLGSLSLDKSTVTTWQTKTLKTSVTQVYIRVIFSWRTRGPYTLHAKLRRFFQKYRCENRCPYIKLLENWSGCEKKFCV